MDSLDVIQAPTLSLLSSSSNNTSSGPSGLPKTINKIVRKKLYKRITTRISPKSSSPRRPSSSRSPPPYRNWRQRRRTLYHKDGANPSLGSFFIRRKSQRSSLSTDTSLSSTRSVSLPVTSTTDRSLNTSPSTHRQRSNFTGELPHTPQSEYYPIIIESDDDDDDRNPVTPSPIRDSPSYGREPRRQHASSRATTPEPPMLYPELPSDTSTDFVRYHRETKHDSTIDCDLIHKLRKGPKGETKNRKLGQVYTAAMEGEHNHVKIGWTEQSVEHRMRGLNSPLRHARIYNVSDTTPGAQRRLVNCYYAEQIIHLELYNSRRTATVLKQGKGEWFEIDMKEAQRVCRKWRKWLIECKPYGENQELTEFWTRRLYIMEQCDAYDAAIHGCLHERWMAFLNPTWWDKTSYKISITWRKISQWWTWFCDNYRIIALLLGIVFWASNGAVSFLLYISIILVASAGLSTTTKEEKRS